MDLAVQRPQPVTLPRPGRSRRPCACLQPTYYGGSDTRDGSLEPIEVSSGPCLHHTPALGTTPTPQQYLMDKPIEQGAYKSMTPDPYTVTSRTRLRPGPRKVTTLLYNLIERNAKRQYHRNILLAVFETVQYSGGCSLKPPPTFFRPIIPTIPPHRSIYSVNLTLFPSTQCGFLQVSSGITARTDTSWLTTLSPLTSLTRKETVIPWTSVCI